MLRLFVGRQHAQMSKSNQNQNRRSKPLSAVWKQEIGKLPPQAVNLEQAVLGCMLIEPKAITEVLDILTAKSFYKEAHQKIFSAIEQLVAKSEPVDLVTVTKVLKSQDELENAGGAVYITELTSRVVSGGNAEYYARVISQKYIQRELIRISSQTASRAFDDSNDVFELLKTAENDLFEISEGNLRKSVDTMSTLLLQAIKQIEGARQQKGGVRGVPSGFRGLDEVTSGFQPSDMVVLAARPGMGKTAFVLSLARNAAVDHNKPLAIFSLEMSSVQLVNRLIAAESEISAKKLKVGNLEPHEWEQLQTKVKRLEDAPIFIDDTPGLSILELRAKCRKMQAKYGLEMVIIDYLQLMSSGVSSKGNREQEISFISRSIKAIAKELNVPIIALSQLSRTVENRDGKRPILSDLRESGAIEQDADMVMFIYRPEYYDLTEDEEGNSTRGRAEVIIAKHRNGSLQTVPLRFIGHLAKFSNLEAESASPMDQMHYDENNHANGNTIIKGSRMDELDDDIPF